jgi:hypothetical protein
LSTVFDGMVKPDENNMKVYLRVRPIKSKEDTTIDIESDTTIISHAPESSKRAQYTKTEARHYVSIYFCFVYAFSLNNNYLTP